MKPSRFFIRARMWGSKIALTALIAFAASSCVVEAEEEVTSFEEDELELELEPQAEFDGNEYMEPDPEPWHLVADESKAEDDDRLRVYEAAQNAPGDGGKEGTEGESHGARD